MRGARNGSPRRRATTTAGSNSRFVRASTARVEPSSGQVRIARSRRTVSSDGSGARTSRPVAAGPARIAFANRSPLCSTSRTARSTTCPRAAVVDLEVDPSQTRQERLEPEDPPDVGESPAVDRLVVVADEEDPVGRGGQQQGEPELGAVDVLDLVDQQLPAATAPAGEQVRVAFQLRDRAKDEVVEVESAARGHGGLVGHERAGDRTRAVVRRDVGGRDAQLDLEPRDRRVESEEIGLVRPRRDRGEDRRTVGERLDRDAGVAQDLAAQGVEGPDTDGSGLDAERRHGRIEPLGHLDGRPLVEGDRPDRVRRRPGRDQPGRAGDQRRRLAAPRRRDAQRRSGRRGRGGSLVGREPGEPLGDRGMEVHRGSLAAAAPLAITGPRHGATAAMSPNRNVVVHRGTVRRRRQRRTVIRKMTAR